MKLTVGYTQMSKNSYGKCNNIEKKGGVKRCQFWSFRGICFRVQVNCVNFNR